MPRPNSSRRSDLFYRPPRTVTVDGKEYPIRWDTQTAFEFMEYTDRSRDDDETFLDTVLSIWYPILPENREKALDAALEFYCGGAAPQEGYYRPVGTGEISRKETYLTLLTRYGIDLNRDPLHWWIFRELMRDHRERRTS